jgi:hypothetical protein
MGMDCGSIVDESGRKGNTMTSRAGSLERHDCIKKFSGDKLCKVEIVGEEESKSDRIGSSKDSNQDEKACKVRCVTWCCHRTRLLGKKEEGKAKQRSELFVSNFHLEDEVLRVNAVFRIFSRLIDISENRSKSQRRTCF